jgi:hypothetical protein
MHSNPPPTAPIIIYSCRSPSIVASFVVDASNAKLLKEFRTNVNHRHSGEDASEVVSEAVIGDDVGTSMTSKDVIVPVVAPRDVGVGVGVEISDKDDDDDGDDDDDENALCVGEPETAAETDDERDVSVCVGVAVTELAETVAVVAVVNVVGSMVVDDTGGIVDVVLEADGQVVTLTFGKEYWRLR